MPPKKKTQAKTQEAPKEAQVPAENPVAKLLREADAMQPKNPRAARALRDEAARLEKSQE